MSLKQKKVIPLKKWSKKLELGASLVEYGLLVALIAIVAIPAVQNVGWKTTCKNGFAAAFLGGVPIAGNPNPNALTTCLGRCCANYMDLQVSMNVVCGYSYSAAANIRNNCF